ncbi:DNA polymerase III, delta subunit [Jannaschia faecimaris]|uniref:DNA-directed DNA polymerase n=1 Tax=Jannaschia faecimaris TaxID=1244108 RepID=A0A1H3IVF6_9RHOB|nr:DNA polymerase III subunit delta [Jannaschia faecimaris]SDY31148.1 DNA polymerase III, delta subunit [Jannaschia faecimaris]
MNLKGAQATKFFAKPDPGTTGVLIYGADAMRVALKRQELILNLAGPDAEGDMRLTRMTGQEAKSDPTAVIDALKAVGMFPGARVVFVDGATELQAGPILNALQDWAKGDAALVVTAGALKKTSKLRKAFESHPNTASIGLYDDPMGRDEIEALIAAEALTCTPEARRDIDALAAALDPGDFRQTLTKIALYSNGEEVTPTAVAAMAPATVDADMDEVILAAADGRAAQIGPLMQRLSGQGVAPVTLAIFATRHFQQLMGLALGTGQAWGPNRDALQRQARAWGVAKAEQALALMMDTDLTLRSSSRAPAMAVMERALIRLAMMARS